jgi:hypothetical protein
VIELAILLDAVEDLRDELMDEIALFDDLLMAVEELLEALSVLRTKVELLTETMLLTAVELLAIFTLLLEALVTADEATLALLSNATLLAALNGLFEPPPPPQAVTPAPNKNAIPILNNRLGVLNCIIFLLP